MNLFPLIRYHDVRLNALRGSIAPGAEQYLVSDHTKRGKVFSTFAEACGYADAIWAATGDIVAVTRTTRRATHVWTTTR